MRGMRSEANPSMPVPQRSAQFLSKMLAWDEEKEALGSSGGTYYHEAVRARTRRRFIDDLYHSTEDVDKKGLVHRKYQD